MPKDTNAKPLTIRDIREVLIPAMEKVFATKKDLEQSATKRDLERFLTKEGALKIFATKKDLGRFATKKDLERFAGKQDLERVKQDLAILKDEFIAFKDESLSKQDEILGKLETLLQEKQFADHQTKRQRRLCRMMVDAARRGKPLSARQLKEIKELGVL